MYMLSGTVFVRSRVRNALLIKACCPCCCCVASENDFGWSRLTSFFSSEQESPSTNSVTLVSSSNALTTRLLPAKHVIYSSRSADCGVFIRPTQFHSSMSFSAKALDSWDLNSNQSLGQRLPPGPQPEISNFLYFLPKKEATYPTGSAGCNVRRASWTENSHSPHSSVRPPTLDGSSQRLRSVLLNKLTLTSPWPAISDIWLGKRTEPVLAVAK